MEENLNYLNLRKNIEIYNVYDIINDDNIDGVMIGKLSSDIGNVIELFKNIDREVQ